MGTACAQGSARVTHEGNVSLFAEIVAVRAAWDRAAVELDAARWPGEVVRGGLQLAARTGPFHRDADLPAACLLRARIWAVGASRAVAGFSAFGLCLVTLGLFERRRARVGCRRSAGSSAFGPLNGFVRAARFGRR